MRTLRMPALTPVGRGVSSGMQFCRRLAYCTCVLIVFCGAGRAEVKKELTEKEKAVLRERQRVSRLVMWARESNATADEVFKKRYEPLVAACKEQGKANTKLAKRFHARGTQAEKDRDEKGARKNYFIAKLFKEYADQNREIIDGIAESDSGKIMGAFETIAKLEAKVKDVTGYEVKRKWLMPSELYPKPAAAAKQANDGRSPSSTPPRSNTRH